MPAGTDLVTWSPRVGATGDDRYDPGANAFTAGSSGSYSSPPTLAEVNAGTGMNQIIAEMKRRYANTSVYLINGFNYGYAAQSYRTAGTEAIMDSRSSTEDFYHCTLLADNLRTVEYGSAFSWSFTPGALTGKAITRQQVLDLRKALATDFIAVWGYKSDYIPVASLRYGLSRSGTTYPPTGTVTLTTTPLIRWQLSGTTYTLTRRHMSFRIPSGMPTIAAAKLHLPSVDSSASGWTMEAYKANTHLDVIDSGDWGNLDTLEDSVTVTAGATETLTFDLDPTNLSSGNHSYILVNSEDPALNAPGAGVSRTSTTGIEMLKLYT